MKKLIKYTIILIILHLIWINLEELPPIDPALLNKPKIKYHNYKQPPKFEGVTYRILKDKKHPIIIKGQTVKQRKGKLGPFRTSSKASLEFDKVGVQVLSGEAVFVEIKADCAKLDPSKESIFFQGNIEYKNTFNQFITMDLLNWNYDQNIFFISPDSIKSFDFPNIPKYKKLSNPSDGQKSGQNAIHDKDKAQVFRSMPWLNRPGSFNTFQSFVKSWKGE